LPTEKPFRKFGKAFLFYIEPHLWERECKMKKLTNAVSKAFSVKAPHPGSQAKPVIPNILMPFIGFSRSTPGITGEACNTLFIKKAPANAGAFLFIPPQGLWKNFHKIITL